MLLKLQNYLLLKLMNKKLDPIYSSSYIDIRYRYKNSIFFSLILNKLNNNLKPFFYLSKNYFNEQNTINKYISLTNKGKFDFILILNSEIKRNEVIDLKKFNLPILTINSKHINKKYFEYFLCINNFNKNLEFLTFKFFVDYFLRNKGSDLKLNYYNLKLNNILKKND